MATRRMTYNQTVAWVCSKIHDLDLTQWERKFFPDMDHRTEFSEKQKTSIRNLANRFGIEVQEDRRASGIDNSSLLKAQANMLRERAVSLRKLANGMDADASFIERTV